MGQNKTHVLVGTTPAKRLLYEPSVEGANKKPGTH